MITYTKSQLMEALGLSRHRLNQYLKQGGLEPVEVRGAYQYFLPDTIQKVKDIMEGKSGV